MSDDLFDAPDLFAPPPAKPPRPRRETTIAAPAPSTPIPPPARDPRMKPNLGECPKSAKGRRVIVELANGKIEGVEPVSNGGPTGWDANSANWRIVDGWPWSIAYWRRA